MTSMILRPIVAPLFGAVLCVVFGPWPGATGRTPLVEQLAARAVTPSGTEDGGPVGIYIERWSTDAELESLRAPIARGETAKVLLALEQWRGRVGVVLMPGVQGRGARVRERTPKNLLFAREIDGPTGRRLVVASDQHLGLGESQIDARKEIYEFNLMEIRFGTDGTGVGKVATTANGVVYDPAMKTLEAMDYAALPARLVNVKPEKF